MSSLLGDGNVSDPYVERLRLKYLVQNQELSSSSSAKDQTTENETFVDLPPNPSLTESERRHYNRAMKELNKAFKIGENSLMRSISEFENTMKSTSGNGDQESHCDSPNSEESSLLYPFPSAESGNTETIATSMTLPTLTSGIATSDPNKIHYEGKSSTFTTTEQTASSQSDIKELDGLSQINRYIHPDGTIKASHVTAIYDELKSIYRKLHEEKCRVAEMQLVEDQLESNFDARDAELVAKESALLEKEKELLQRDYALSVAEQNMKKTQEITARLAGVELEVQERIDLLQEHHDLEMERKNTALQEKCQEYKRLKSSYDAMKEQNENLRSQLANVTDNSKKVKAQNTKMKKRLENLQRRQDFKDLKSSHTVGDRKLEEGKENVDERQKAVGTKSTDKCEKQIGGMLETLAAVLDWITEVHLKHPQRRIQKLSSSKSQDRNTALSSEYVTDKCLKVLPLLVEIIRTLPSYPSASKLHPHFLSFIYWSLCHLDDSQHALLSSTSRRLGDELYRPSIVSSRPQNSQSTALILATATGSSTVNSSLDLSTGFGDSKTYLVAYFRSSCPQERLLSSFIILKTLHQVDVLAHVFGRLVKDLKDEANRETFIAYNAGHILFPYVTYKANRVLMSNVVDVVLQMLVESAQLPVFLKQCSNENWFRAFSSAIRPPSSAANKGASLDAVTLEKLSIILQKLSKIKGNRKFFEAFSMERNLQELYRSCDPKNTFLLLNLRSILFNLNALKGSSTVDDGTA